MNKKNKVKSNKGSEGESLYKNLSIYRNNEIKNGYNKKRKKRGKIKSKKENDERRNKKKKKKLRG